MMGDNMKQYKKPAKFYLMLFIITFGVVGAYTLYLFFTDALTAPDIWNLLVLPVVFTGIYWAGDSVMQKIKDKRYKTNYEDRFLELVNNKMRSSNQFLIEDFRRIQMNVKFQESLKMAYFIYQNGENDIFTLSKLEKKFDPKTTEARAMTFVINEVREKLENKTE